jgi:hypothetical protein
MGVIGMANHHHWCEFCGNITIFPPYVPMQCLFCVSQVVDCGGFKIRVRDDLACGLT